MLGGEISLQKGRRGGFLPSPAAPGEGSRGPPAPASPPKPRGSAGEGAPAVPGALRSAVGLNDRQGPFQRDDSAINAEHISPGAGPSPQPTPSVSRCLPRRPGQMRAAPRRPQFSGPPAPTGVPAKGRMRPRHRARTRPGSGGRGQAARSSPAASLNPRHTPTTTAPLCLFELSLPISANK